MWVKKVKLNSTQGDWPLVFLNLFALERDVTQLTTVVGFSESPEEGREVVDGPLRPSLNSSLWSEISYKDRSKWWSLLYYYRQIYTPLNLCKMCPTKSIIHYRRNRGEFITSFTRVSIEDWEKGNSLLYTEIRVDLR